MVATDGHRLALHDAGPCPDGANGMPGVIIPHKTVKLLRALLQPVYEGRGKSQTRVTPDHVGITVNCTKIRFRFGNYEVVSKLIDGTFPDYRRVMPNPARFTRATMGANEFAAMVSKVASISSERGRAVKLEFDGGLVMASISNPDAGSISDMMTADVEGPALAIGLNARYVMDILAHFKGLPITFQMEDQGSPARITGAPRTTIVLMPMRI